MKARRSTNGNMIIKRNKDVSENFIPILFYNNYHLVLPPFFFFFLFAFLEELAGLDGLVSALGDDEDGLSAPRLPPMLALPVPPIPPPATKAPCGPLVAAFLFLPLTR